MVNGVDKVRVMDKFKFMVICMVMVRVMDKFMVRFMVME